MYIYFVSLTFDDWNAKNCTHCFFFFFFNILHCKLGQESLQCFKSACEEKQGEASSFLWIMRKNNRWECRDWHQQSLGENHGSWIYLFVFSVARADLNQVTLVCAYVRDDTPSLSRKIGIKLTCLTSLQLSRKDVQLIETNVVE